MRTRTTAMAMALLSAFAAAAFADDAPPTTQPTPLPLLHPMLSDHAVLQRGRPIPVWGWTTPGARVRIAFDDQRVEALADTTGRWEASFPAMAAGGPYTLRVDAGDASTVRTDLLVGDVWVCAGQSNMLWMLRSSRDNAPVIKNSDNAKLRFFRVPSNTSVAPVLVPDASWQISSPETSRNFSAVAYFFGAYLQPRIDVPVGLIQIAYGGASIEAFISWDRLETVPAYRGAIQTMRQLNDGRDPVTAYKEDMKSWYASHDAGTIHGWETPEVDDRAWETVELPAAIESTPLGDFDGVVWFRRTVTLTAEQAQAPFKISLGPIDDRDTVWINGEFVGASDWYSKPRTYTIKPGVLKKGTNTIAIRVLDVGGGGGFYGKAKELELVGPSASVALAGQWRYRAGVALSDVEGPPAPTNLGSRQQLPGVIYNGMMRSVGQIPLRGVVWYQGETMTTSPDRYGKTMLPMLIEQVRADHLDPDLAFGIVQLPNFGSPSTQPVGGGWAEIRAAQAEPVSSMRHLFLAVTIDAGDAKNIHPPNKQPVGERLARRALASVYGNGDPATGPIVSKWDIDGAAVVLQYEHAGERLIYRPIQDRASGFAIKDAAGHWHHADPEITGTTVRLTAKGVDRPTGAAYAWDANPPSTLYSSDNLPARPWRSDRASDLPKP